ncbi:MULTISPECIES: class E sortase [unclassified Streptomyces]|uniref:class E sortase n=1 Tax=unclassified Streptomyces TaxID=2593676 RepID=UPI001EFE5515|nr:MULTISPECIES: class E sortase [unclassified Streptomyces]
MRRRLLVRALWGFAEVAVSLGVVLLLLVAHQLWWTNRLARDDAGRTVQALEREWGVPVSPSAPGPGAGAGPGAGVAPGAAPGPGAVAVPGPSSAAAPSGQPPSPRWDQAYAVLRIPASASPPPSPKAPARAASSTVGTSGTTPAPPRAGQAGNFALAGHRNTHGEPFRRIDRLRRGDRITVETRDAVYTYTVDKSLARTAPSDSGVIAPVPRSGITTSAGYGEPGYYLTLTTCTPEFSSRYRLVVWGKLTAMRPR